ncbi:hypothetical protein COW86_02635 [Candidatus Kuenenbacteria bacterium CG22_combo_CG10-13_8_21_14_all_39_9]|uniref:Uncharacterized protein n=1 Tax=Candidatus Kuenenbacteria bacterium CG22_combo_CG10-13_8_21_14_all_39_9 TaxID=1974621 RepID=A0A2H0D1Z2_9BACT|nr:MAG: hypothetical protein COW86_02635 [Candidatus Kuenenbacteria bacterium CG22_combo_CG10-13_8_21_14_all_39_9]
MINTTPNTEWWCGIVSAYVGIMFLTFAFLDWFTGQAGTAHFAIALMAGVLAIGAGSGLIVAAGQH